MHLRFDDSQPYLVFVCGAKPNFAFIFCARESRVCEEILCGILNYTLNYMGKFRESLNVRNIFDGMKTS